uniref:Allene oxide synthase n=1 Tax=Pohlia nutans TaxID=140635 RepID=A0A4P8JGS7_9BRYO|nr:allene oxide synthase [Pohlia nutans]
MALPSLTAHRSLCSSSFNPVLRWSDQRSRVCTSGMRKREAGVAVASLKSMDQLSSSDDADVRADSSALPLKEIPGGYGIPFLSQLVNRWRFFYIEGEPKYWEKRMQQYNSTVFRTNMPPGWPWTDSRCVMFLDQKSYPTVFDYDKVDKHRSFAGTFMPSTSYTGGMEMCAYLDPTDKKHEQLKAYCFELLKLAAPKWAAEFHTSIGNAFQQWEYKLSQNQPALVSPSLPEFMFRFLVNAITSADLDDARVPDSERPAIADLQKWAGSQLIPVINTGSPVYLEELLHLAPIPAKFTKGNYDKFIAFLQNFAQDTLEIALSHGLNKEEAVHNLIFFLILNAHGGFCIFFPVILREVAKNPELQAELRAEVRAATKSSGGEVTMKAVMNSMPLVASTVYEALRFEPPVRFQYARAKKDFVVESHDARFEIKKGELMGGVNYFVSRDPKVFKEDPTKFVAKRFMGAEGEKLLKHLVWSNGRQTDESSVHSKQCAAKDIVPLTGRLLLAEIFTRYDSFTVEGLGSKMAFTSLQRRADL